MDPKPMPPTQPDDQFAQPTTEGTGESRQVSVDIQGAPDMPRTTDDDTMSPETPSANATPAPDPLKTPTTGAVPAAPSAAEGLGLPPSPAVNDQAPGIAPSGAVPGAPGAGMPDFSATMPIVGAPSAQPDAGPAPAAGQTAVPPLFAPDAPTMPSAAHAKSSQGHRMMLAIVGLLVIMVVAVIAAFVIAR